MSNVAFSSLEILSGQIASVVLLSGQLDETNNDAVFEAVGEYFELNHEQKYFIFDISKLEYLNSRSIGNIVDSFRKTAERGGKMVIAGSSQNIYDILDLVGVTRVIEMAETLEHAKTIMLDAVKAG